MVMIFQKLVLKPGVPKKVSKPGNKLFPKLGQISIKLGFSKKRSGNLKIGFIPRKLRQNFVCHKSSGILEIDVIPQIG